MSKETIVQGRLLSKEDYCPRRHLSKETIVQGDNCPRRLLSKETFVQGDYCPSTNEYLTDSGVPIEKKRVKGGGFLGHKMSSDNFGQKSAWTNVSLDNSLLGQKSPWTIVSLDKSLLGQKSLGQTSLGQKSPWTKVSLDKSPLGQTSPWTIAPWTIVPTPPKFWYLKVFKTAPVAPTGQNQV